MILLLAVLQAAFGAVNFGFYVHNHHTFSLVAAVICGVGALYSLILAANQ